MKVKIKSPQELSVMREGGKRLIQIFKILKEYVREGVTLKKLDQIARATAKKLGGYPSFLGHEGYPAAICTSVNSGIVHCIPNNYRLRTGDLLSVDCGFLFGGLHTDATASWIVGKDIYGYTPLLRAVYRALLAGTGVIKPGVKVGQISQAIENHLTGAQLTIMRQFVGHGVGRDLHEPPIIPNFVGHDKDIVLPAGSVVAIEPIAGGGAEAHKTAPDKWSTKTVDDKVVAHFEHTVAVTPSGPEVLTPLGEIIDVLA